MLHFGPVLLPCTLLYLREFLLVRIIARVYRLERSLSTTCRPSSSSNTEAPNRPSNVLPLRWYCRTKHAVSRGSMISAGSSFNSPSLHWVILRHARRNAECPVWVAPWMQELFEGLALWSGTVLCPALYEADFVKDVLLGPKQPVEPGVSRR